MNRLQDALDRLRKTAQGVKEIDAPYEMNTPSFGHGCTTEEIDELQALTRGALPEDYREYLTTCRRIDAESVFCGYFLFSPIGIASGDDSRPRFLHVEMEGHEAEVFVLPIGGDGGGNLFLMGTSPNALGVVWKWSHEYPVRFDGMANEGLSRVASSFTEFLERMASDWEHFVASDSDREYLSG